MILLLPLKLNPFLKNRGIDMTSFGTHLMAPKRILTTALLSLMTLSLIGCEDLKAAFQQAKSLEIAKVWIANVKFKVAGDVNNNAPVSVNLVIAYDKVLSEELSKMTAEYYFEHQQQIRNDNGQKIQIESWEVSPGKAPDDTEIYLNHPNGESATVFARYSSLGDHRQALGDDRDILINLEKVDFDVQKLR